MSAFDWALIVMFALGAVGKVVVVGHPRGPVTPNLAAAEVVFAIAMILGVVFFR